MMFVSAVARLTLACVNPGSGGARGEGKGCSREEVPVEDLQQLH